MNNKGQGALEYFMEYAWVVIVLAVVVGVLVFIVVEPSEPDMSLPAFKFCKAWAEEKGVTHIEGNYTYVLSTRSQKVQCVYSTDAEVFDGGVSTGERKNKYFSISEEALLEWENKGESKSCCEECC